MNEALLFASVVNNHKHSQHKPIYTLDNTLASRHIFSFFIAFSYLLAFIGDSGDVGAIHPFNKRKERIDSTTKTDKKLHSERK